jgi:glycosyltransferase involved in cell wall biosynthesis
MTDQKRLVPPILTSNQQPTTELAPNSPPVFSIITVCYNGAALLPGTIESVMAQTWPHIEYLIIDGKSKDKSLEIIEMYALKMPNLRYVSEPDRGLYDAMNKGLRMATGDFVWFLNCGDHLHAADTVALCAALTGTNTDVLYGETLLVDDDRKPAGTMSELSTRKLPTHLHWRQYLGGMLVVHQSFVPRRTLAPAYATDNLCADYDWCIQILKKSRENQYTGLILSDYLMGGMSKQRHQQSLKDRFKVMRKHFGLGQTLLAHVFIVLRALWHRILRIGKQQY